MRPAVGALVVALVALAAGCAAPPSAPEPVWVGPPEGAGGFAPCASSQAIELAVADLRAQESDDARGRPPGIHQLDNGTLLWVWASYEDTPRRDDLTRLNRVTVHREASGEIVICTRAELTSEVFTDGTPQSYDVAALLVAPHGWPPGPQHVVVNWVVGCTGCVPPLTGNTTAHFS